MLRREQVQRIFVLHSAQGSSRKFLFDDHGLGFRFIPRQFVVESFGFRKCVEYTVCHDDAYSDYSAGSFPEFKAFYAAPDFDNNSEFSQMTRDVSNF